MTYRLAWIIAAAFVAIVLTAFLARAGMRADHLPTPQKDFVYPFTTPGVLAETDSPDHSASEYWWLNSGGKLIITEEYGETIQGPLHPLDPWRLEYALDNPVDTQTGFYPQNLFRLLTRSQWRDVRTQASFYIVASNGGLSPNRNESNGLFLMSRYSPGGQTLYYAGVRVDGMAIVKKKYRGEYTTLAETVVFPGEYSHETKTNLLPHGKWLGLRMETQTHEGAVTIRLFMKAEDGTWRELLTAVDTGSESEKPILQSGPVGIRTDFMDVRFRDFRAEPL